MLDRKYNSGLDDTFEFNQSLEKKSGIDEQSIVTTTLQDTSTDFEDIPVVLSNAIQPDKSKKVKSAKVNIDNELRKLKAEFVTNSKSLKHVIESLDKHEQVLFYKDYPQYGSVTTISDFLGLLCRIIENYRKTSGKFMRSKFVCIFAKFLDAGAKFGIDFDKGFDIFIQDIDLMEEDIRYFIYTLEKDLTGYVKSLKLNETNSAATKMLIRCLVYFLQEVSSCMPR